MFCFFEGSHCSISSNSVSLSLSHLRSSIRNSTLLALCQCLAITLWPRPFQRTHVPPNFLRSTKRSKMNSITSTHKNIYMHLNSPFMISLQRNAICTEDVLWPRTVCRYIILHIIILQFICFVESNRVNNFIWPTGSIYHPHLGIRLRMSPWSASHLHWIEQVRWTLLR